MEQRSLGQLQVSVVGLGCNNFGMRLGQDRPAGSRLAGWGDRADAFIDDRKLAIVERLVDWASERGHSLLDLAFSWHTSLTSAAGCPVVASVIAGATGPEQVAANVAAVGWALTTDDRAEVDAIVRA